MKTRVLVVDDSPTIRKVVSSILERHGYDAVTAADGQRALDILALEPDFDIVLVDFVMPRMNGFQFCRALRDREENASTPVVLMSARTDKIREQFVQQTGAIDAITKPFDAQALVAVIEHAMRRLRAGRLVPSVTALPDDEPDSDGGGAREQATPTADVDVRVATAAADLARQIAEAIAPAIAQLPGVAAESASERALASALVAHVSTDAMRALAYGAQALDFGGKGKLVLSGDLAIIPIGAVLQLLQIEQKTGLLVVSNAKSEVTIAMNAGLIDFVVSENAGDEFRLGRFFVEQGLITPAQLTEVLARQAEIAARVGRQGSRASVPPPALAAPPSSSPISSSRVTSVPPSSSSKVTLAPIAPIAPVAPVAVDLSSQDEETQPPPATAQRDSYTGLPSTPPLLGDVLMRGGYVSESHLREALARQSSELTYEVLRWQRGRFEFRKEPAVSSSGGPISARTHAATPKLGLPVAHVVMEGFRRVDEWRLIESRIDNFDAVLQPDRVAMSALDAASETPLTKAEIAMLDMVDGERTVRELIAASHMSSFDASKILYQLLEARLVRRRPATP